MEYLDSLCVGLVDGLLVAWDEHSADSDLDTSFCAEYDFLQEAANPDRMAKMLTVARVYLGANLFSHAVYEVLVPRSEESLARATEVYGSVIITEVFSAAEFMAERTTIDTHGATVLGRLLDCVVDELVSVVFFFEDVQAAIQAGNEPDWLLGCILSVPK